MRHMFKFPDIGEGITEGQIVEWRVKRGQQVQTGDPLVEMETDKVVTDIPSPRDGTVVALYGSEGDTINVGDPLVELEIEGVSSEEAQQIAQEKPAPPSQEPVDEGDGGVVGTIEVAGEGAYLPASDEGVDRSEETQSGRRRGKALATPVARAVARNLNIDINRIRGTGPAGRVTKDDVHRFAERQADGETAAPSRSGRGGRAAATAGGTDAPRGVGGQPGTGPRPADEETEELEYRQLSGIRKTIARHMVESKHNAAHMSVTEEAEISELVELRARHKQRFADRGVRLTYLPFVLKAVAAALKRHPSLNAEMDLEHNRMIYYHRYNLGIAVDTDDGLVVPVIRDVDRRPLSEIAAAIDDLSTRARERKLSMDELKGGTFSVTSYGSIGGLFAVPVINYPEAAILGIGRIHKRPIVIEGPGGDEIGIGTIMPLSLSVDHRIVDGGEATRFLNDIVEFLESPASMFID
ncbi:MAG: dihydrolipoamide acetyltransferase family protein [Spirochaetaceae bacterium]